MTSELENRFYETFGIEPEEEKYCMWECKIPELEHVACNKQCEHQRHNISYPAITDRILLELICLLDFDTHCGNVETLKEKILTQLRGLLSYMRQVHHILDKENDIYKKVRAVFGLESEARI